MFDKLRKDGHLQMLPYLFVSVSILLFGLYYETVNASVRKFGKRLPRQLFLIPSFVLLLFFSAFRGDFTTDYQNYVYLFELYNSFDFWDTFQARFYQESGYIFLSRVIGEVADNPVYLFAVTSFIILWGFFLQIKKHSNYIWLSVLMLVTVGAFYDSFNILRQILAVSIVFAGSDYLYERKFRKYLLVVIVGSLFHTSALVMIPFYFLLNSKLSKKNLLAIVTALVFSLLYLNRIIEIAQKFFYSVYTEAFYGMTGLTFTNAVLPLALLAFTFMHFRKLDYTDKRVRIWVNAAVFYAFFSVLGLRVQMVERISDFFAPYSLLLVPLIFSRMKNTLAKIVYMGTIVILLILYNYVVLSGSGYDPYFFIWS